MSKMQNLSRIPGDDNLFVGGIWILNIESYRNQLYENNVTHILSAIKWSFERWGVEEANRFQHMSIDVDDDESSDIVCYFPAAVRFIDEGLHSPESTVSTAEPKNGVYVHCAMGKSRSVSCVIAYLLYKYPHRFGGEQFANSLGTPQQRRSTATAAVNNALQCVRSGRPNAEPNPGFMRQLELWWEIGCPADDDGAVEQHPTYQRWRYDMMLQEARDARMAPDAEDIRFERLEDEEQAQPGKKMRCKKCNTTLATTKFLVPHASSCSHIFIDTLSWMRPMLEDGALDGRLICPNSKCGATVGRFAWQGLKCTCGQYVVPAFSLNRSRVDEMSSGTGGPAAIRMPPGRNGNL
ncbi:protein-tyrosine phosphatase-like protein [Xylaria sp. CBS 124048]|nr:protein-tyrosine phosphatase-like protein [Xylaria sp. CBS 124048]